jgi:alpha-L-rhamnosidase
MRRTVYLFLAILSVLRANAQIELQCEHLVSPIGIDARHPRLNWQSPVQQKSFRLTVSSGSIVCWRAAGSAANPVTYVGKPLRPFTRYEWKLQLNNSAASASGTFETGPLSTSDWQGDWISDVKDIHLKPAAEFSKAITVTKPIKSARIYIACGGLYELWLNGQKVGDHILDPMFTRFDRRNLYVTYDVTYQLAKGSNAINVLLGNGWYNHQSTAVWFYDKAPWRQRPCFCLDLRITYMDGTTETISTDKTWSWTLSGISSNSIYTGEHADANAKLAVIKGEWHPVIVVHAPSEHIVAQALYPIRDCEKLKPLSLKKFSDTDYVFNIGRNIAGVSEITLKAKAGTVIWFKHAERLDSAGHADQSNINYHYRPVGDSDPFQTDVYTLDGKTDTLRPHFNYKGFRYVEVNSTSAVVLDKSSLVAYFEHSDVPAVGTITSSDTLIDRLWRATNNSYLSNLFGYPTDCPQREKNGWTGDAHTAVETGLYNFDAITIYEKWLTDIRDAQQPNGTIPAIVPTSDWGYDHHNGPDWVSAIAIIPWELYQFYGDSNALADNYEAIKRYVNLLNRKFPNYLCNWGLGDWIPIKSFAPVEFTSTVFYYQDALILAKTAKLFNKKQDAIYYLALAEKIKTAFNLQYLRENGNYDKGFQTELSFALYYHLVPENLRAKTAALLAKAVTDGGVHLDVGLLGSKTILSALSDNGYGDLAYQLATLKTYPSWGYWMTQGMTTLPEKWDIGPKSNGSLNHIMFGSISAWFYRGLGGIQPDESQPGFRHIVLRPYIPAGLDSFSAEHESPFGKIRSGWTTQNGKVIYTATIPPNSIADLVLEVHGRVIKRASLAAGTYHYEFTRLTH